MAELTPLPDLEDGSLTGPNLDMDPVFAEMEQAAKGKPENQYGSTIEAAVPPNWKDTAGHAEALLARTRDLRVMVTYALARLHLNGLPGYAGIVALIRHTLETLWEPVHPVLDPEDDNDPMQRANALLMLQDPVRVLRPLRELPLASTPRGGPVSWRDIAVMNGALEPEPGREKLSESVVRGVFAGTDAKALATLKTVVDGLVADLVAIPKTFDTYSVIGSGPDLRDILKLTRDIQKELNRFGTVSEALEEVEEPAPVAEATAVETVAAAPRAPRGVVSMQSITSIGTREDALRALELAAGYFRSSEPSSPLPLLIDRALLLAPMPFLDILRNLAPDGLMQAQNVAGTTD